MLARERFRRRAISAFEMPSASSFLISALWCASLDFSFLPTGWPSLTPEALSAESLRRVE